MDPPPRRELPYGNVREPQDVRFIEKDEVRNPSFFNFSILRKFKFSVVKSTNNVCELEEKDA